MELFKCQPAVHRSTYIVLLQDKWTFSLAEYPVRPAIEDIVTVASATTKGTCVRPAGILVGKKNQTVVYFIGVFLSR
jgi:hypothetical protein